MTTSVSTAAAFMPTQTASNLNASTNDQTLQTESIIIVKMFFFKLQYFYRFLP